MQWSTMIIGGVVVGPWGEGVILGVVVGGVVGVVVGGVVGVVVITRDGVVVEGEVVVGVVVGRVVKGLAEKNIRFRI